MINLKRIPPIDEILSQPGIQALITKYQREFVVDTTRQVVAQVREELKTVQDIIEKDRLMDIILRKTEQKAESRVQGTLQTVINGTGVVLHTNLGRAPLGDQAMKYVKEIGNVYNNLEIDLEKGERGSRYYHVEELLKTLTGAEAALLVNNNAAAVMLGLTTLADQREVIVSRGQLVEIGGAFRIPEVMKLSGAHLVEVGTTNKTYISDYAGAVSDATALLFTAHTSNYKIVGFSSEVSTEELVALGREKGIPVMQDLGSGILTPLDDWGLKEEPTVQDCIKAGVDVVTFSGDKLLGGPQAGIIIGKKEYIDRMKKNQLLRALRVDKLSIAALEGTLLEYLSGHPRENIPVLRMLTMDQQELRVKAGDLHQTLTDMLGDYRDMFSISCIELEDMVGGGAYPTYKIPGAGVEIEFKGISLEQISRELRVHNPALLTRRQDNKMLISVRTILSGQDKLIAEMFKHIFQKIS